MKRIDNHFIDPVTFNESQIINCVGEPADVDDVHYLHLHYRHCVQPIKLRPIPGPKTQTEKLILYIVNNPTQPHSHTSPNSEDL